MWNFAKHWMDEGTLNKVKIFGSDFKEALAVVVPEDVPDYLGGPYKGANPGGPFKLDVTGLEPDEEDKKEAEKVKVTVGSRDYYEAPITITKPGTYIGWEFTTEHHNIAFSVFYQETTDAEKVYLRDLQKHDSHQEVIQDTIEVEKPGIYTFHWDNTFSILRSKQLTYFLLVTVPADEQTENKEQKVKRKKKKKKDITQS